MISLALQRLAAMVPLLLLVSVLVFLLSLASPVDPARLLVGDFADRETYEQARVELGLDDPLAVQYGRWVSRAVRGDLGTSAYSSQPVMGTILQRLPVTLSITALAAGFAVLIGISVGIVGALRPGGWLDRGSLVVASIGMATPNFWLGMLLVVGFALQLRWFPATGYVSMDDSVLGWLRSITLPAFALGTSASAALARQMRSSLVGTMQQDYVRLAVAKGYRRARVVGKHALKNSLIPVVTLLGFHVTALLGGSLIVEQVFAVPGLGQLVIGAVQRQDLPMVQGVVLLAAVVVVMVQFLMDLSYGYLNPKVRVS